jgi:hypothetical protein
MSNLASNHNSRSDKYNNGKVKFEDTLDGQLLLNSLNPSFQKIRKENQYVGETRIMQYLSKKKKESSYSQAFNEEFNPVSKDNDKYGSTEKKRDVSLSDLQRQTGFIRTTLPKN